MQLGDYMLVTSPACAPRLTGVSWCPFHYGYRKKSQDKGTFAHAKFWSMLICSFFSGALFLLVHPCQVQQIFHNILTKQRSQISLDSSLEPPASSLTLSQLAIFHSSLFRHQLPIFPQLGPSNPPRCLAPRFFSIVTSCIAGLAALILPYCTTLPAANLLHLLCASMFISQSVPWFTKQRGVILYR